MKADLDGATPITIRSFEVDQVINVAGGGTVEVNHNHHNGLDGKISRVEVSIF